MIPLVEVRNLTKHFPVTRGIPGRREVGRVHAVDDVSFTIERGRTLGLVGETGCGKSTTARMILRLLQPTAGTIHFDGVDITRAGHRALRPLRRRMQIIFQDPFSSLDPRMTVGEIIEEPLRIHALAPGGASVRRVGELMDLVGLDANRRDRFPHEFSGGQRQRVGIARALAVEPELIVCDEPVSALDVSIRAQIINLLKDIQEELNLTYLFIAHDLSVVRHFCDRCIPTPKRCCRPSRSPTPSRSARGAESCSRVTSPVRCIRHLPAASIPAAGRQRTSAAGTRPRSSPAGVHPPTT
jgi:oligopeptide transport system ATP-binding protein